MTTWKHQAGTLGPDDGQHTLRQKAAGAWAAVKIYARLAGLEGENETAVKDLLTDLRHFCDQEGYNFEELNEGAERFYVNEVDGKE